MEFLKHGVFVRYNFLATWESRKAEVCLGKCVLKICSKFTGEYPCRSTISIMLYSNFIETTLRHGRSAVNLLDMFRTPFSENSSGWVVLNLPLVVTDLDPDQMLEQEMVWMLVWTGSSLSFNQIIWLRVIKDVWQSKCLWNLKTQLESWVQKGWQTTYVKTVVLKLIQITCLGTAFELYWIQVPHNQICINN